MRSSAWLLPVALTSGLLLGPAAKAEVAESALRLEADSTASRELVALGRDLEVAGHARADAVAVGGSVRVTGRVDGDIIVLDGDAILEGTAVVGGDVYVLGGRLDMAPGAALGGRGAAYPTAAGTLLTLLEGPSLGLEATSPIVLGAKVGLLAAWLLATLIALILAGRAVLATSARAGREPMRDFLTGLAAVFTLALTCLFLASFAPAVASVPLLVLLIVAAMLLKVWGMVALFHRIGEGLLRRLTGRRPQPVQAALVGLLALGGLRFVPWVGIWAWTAASLVAVGLSLRALLARREHELGVADLDRLASIVR